MEGTRIVLLVASVFAVGAGLKLPHYVKPCARSDPNFNQCAIEHARETLTAPEVRKGDRKYNVPPIDPLLITEIKLSESNGLTITIKDAKFYGFPDTKLENANFDFEKMHVSGDLSLPVLQIIGKYEAEGKLLLLPLNGKGDINITLVNAKLTVETDLTLKQIENREHVVLKNSQVTVTPSRMYVYLSNLFNGDKLLGKETNEVLNASWEELYTIMSPSITEAIVQAMETIMNGIAAVVPFEEAFPETLP
ncbi:hypothetical protein B7P43_G07901 [Cryptotermes secundus]|uniref:Protein takeout n=2 Tax=Cryptotermes secundus TaxID=105785 RepID=A0A2J7QTJ6_9NEOP|nr:hypothetical protein B7P43_G07901 [Cryptotermes secundus]